MEDLRLVGVSDDGSHVVVESVGGQKYGLALDERLHAALRGDRARLGQLQISIENELRPREIQARIRAGETAESIAAQAGLPVDRVRRYEGPVLLERTVVAQNAQTVGIRRVTDSETTALGQLVRTRLDSHRVAEDSIDWDSWLHPDGRWVVRLAYRAADHDRSASWLYDPARRTVEPLDDDARWLTDEERAAPEPPSRRRPPRLAAVPADEPPEEVGRHDTVPIASRRGPRRVPDLPPGVGDDVPGQASPRAGDAKATDQPAKPPIEVPAHEPDQAAGEDRSTAREPARRPAPARVAGKGRAPKRASVPSWDEILFGGPKRED
jgi:Protein of unknown function (DUF3071)